MGAVGGISSDDYGYIKDSEVVTMRKVLNTLLIAAGAIVCGIIAVNLEWQPLGIPHSMGSFEYKNQLVLGGRYLANTVDSSIYDALNLSKGIQSTEDLDKMLYTALMNSRFSGSSVGESGENGDSSKGNGKCNSDGKDAGNVVEDANAESGVNKVKDSSNATSNNDSNSANNGGIVRDVPSIQTQTGVTSYQNVGKYSDWSTIGYLTISDIGIIREPVVLGFSQAVVDNNSLAMYNDIRNYPGGMRLTRICGHNTGILGRLERLGIGSEIYLETIYGYNYKYVVEYNDVVYNDEDDRYWYGYNDRVSGERILEPSELSQDLCIFTCVDGMPTSYRRYVRGRYIEGVKLSGLESVSYE